jgi:hypothetical protein
MSKRYIARRCRPGWNSPKLKRTGGCRRLGSKDATLSLRPIGNRPPKTELFSRSEPPAKIESPTGETLPFSNPALRKLREMLQRDSVNEEEVIRVLREATPRGTYPPASLDEAPERTLSLLLSRWEVTRELIEASRSDGREAA